MVAENLRIGDGLEHRVAGKRKQDKDAGQGCRTRKQDKDAGHGCILGNGSTTSTGGTGLSCDVS